MVTSIIRLLHGIFIKLLRLTWSANTTDIPFVHSLSVGGDESEFARDNGGDIAITRMNNEMAALGVRGVSILFASGDSGYSYFLFKLCPKS